MRIFILVILLMTVSVHGEDFSIDVELSETYGEVQAGENIWFTVTIVPEEDSEMVLTYEIIDSSEVAVASSSDRIDATISEKLLRKLLVPTGISGMHTLRVTANSSTKSTETQIGFTVTEEPTIDDQIRDSSLLDLKITIPDDYKEISAGNEILASIKLMNMGSKGRVDIFLDYEISGQDRTLLTNKETVAMETQANFVRTFNIPKNTKPGIYNIKSAITYADGKTAASETSFTVIAKKSYKIIYIIAGVISVISIIIFVIHTKKEDIKRWRMRRRISSIVDRRN